MVRNSLSKFSSLWPRKGAVSFEEARIKLFYLMLGANVVKGLLYLYDAFSNHQGDGSGRALRLILSSMLLMLALRFFPKYIKFGIHWAVIATILHVYYRAFNENVGADVITIQAIMMVIVSSFYGLNARWGAFYTIIACIAPVLCHYVAFRWTGLSVLPQALNDTYIGVNFIVILLSHVYFHRVLFGTLSEKERLNKELKLTVESKSIFLSTMAHELRTPLNSVIGISNLLIADSENEKQKEQLDVLKFSAGNLVALINDILDINKLEAGKIALEKLPFNCNSLLGSIASSVEAQAREKFLDFNLDIDSDIKNKTYLSDVTRLSQVLFNLIGNAVKFTEKGYVKASAHLITKEENRDLIRFKVADSGIGMSESQLRVIFDPFVQAAASTTRKFGGTGLGLSIVKQLLEIFGSEIHLESKPGHGTVMYFDLWLDVTMWLPAVKAEAADEPEVQLSNLKVLLVEDNIMNIYFMKQLFLRWDLKADFAENGQQAVESVKNKAYDVVLMDMYMPVMDGIEAARKIRLLPDPNRANVYIIALTASVSEDVKDHVLASGMNDYLTKPFQLDDLKSKLIASTK